MVAQVFAGFVVGFGLSLLVAPVAAIGLVRSNGRTGLAQRVAPPGTNMIALSMMLHVAAVIVLTAIGMLFGMLLGGLENQRPEGGFGSPNLAFTLIVVALTAVAVIPLLVVPAARHLVVIAAVVFAVAFGWAMPWLATLG